MNKAADNHTWLSCGGSLDAKMLPQAVAAFIPLAAVAILLSPSLGGYGFISWCFHPLLAVVGVLILGPLGLLLGVESPDRRVHASLMGGAAVSVVAAAATAWWSHETAGHRHFPRWEKPLVYHLHVFGGYTVCVALLAQAAGGAAALFGLRAGAPLEVLRKVHKNLVVAASAVVVLLSGFGIPMWVKGGGPALFGVLVAAVAWGAARVFMAVPKARGGGGR